MASRALLAPLASLGWARLVPQGSQARLDHQDSQGCGESRGYEGTRASGGPQDLLVFLVLQELLSLENQVPRVCQGLQDLGGNQDPRESLDPEEIGASRGITEWANQGFLGPLGRQVPLGPLGCLVQLAWANQVWMGSQEPQETKVTLGPLGSQVLGENQELLVQKAPLG